MIEAWRGGILVGIRNWNADVVSKFQSRSSPKVKLDRFAALVLILAFGVLEERARWHRQDVRQVSANK